MKIYDFTVKNRKSEDISLENFKGKVLLIVNTATRCGFTPQYDELEALYSKYNKDGFEVLDFPCNQFGNQAPESDEEIQIIGFLDETNERDKGIRYKPFDVKFTENQDWVKKIYFKDGVIYIWDN